MILCLTSSVLSAQTVAQVRSQAFAACGAAELAKGLCDIAYDNMSTAREQVAIVRQQIIFLGGNHGVLWDAANAQWEATELLRTQNINLQTQANQTLYQGNIKLSSVEYKYWNWPIVARESLIPDYQECIAIFNSCTTQFNTLKSSFQTLTALYNICQSDFTYILNNLPPIQT